MEIKRSSRNYSSAKIVTMASLSFLCAVVILILFAAFALAKKPSVSDMSKFVLATIGVSFILFIAYGICGFIKDDDIYLYGRKTFAYATILLVAVITTNIVALVKHHSYIFPNLIHSVSIGTAVIIFFVNLQFLLNDVPKSNLEYYIR